jgi:hypothetical protein
LDAKIIPKTYIIRVYRFARDNPRRLVGVVEEAGKKGKKAFTGYQELWEILNWPGRSKSTKRRKAGEKRRENRYQEGGKYK